MWISLVAFSSLTVSAVAACPDNFDPAKSLVHGPGLVNPLFNLPVRYFFVQLVDVNSQNISNDFSNGDARNCIKVSITGILTTVQGKRESCRLRTDTINRHDGSYIIRYRLFSSCDALTILVSTSTGQLVGQSPYILKGSPRIYAEDCNCPVSDVAGWLKNVGCPSLSPDLHLVNSLSHWPSGSVNFTYVVEQVQERFGSRPGAYSLCHYIIFDNKIYRKCYGEHVGFNIFSDAILLSLARKMRLPNVEFFMNLGDWPLSKRGSNSRPLPLPIISWCGSDETVDIVLPTYELTEATLEMMARQSLDMFSVQRMTQIRFADKISRAFWRGRDSRQERLDAVLISRENPDLLDAAITNFFFFRDQMDKYGSADGKKTYVSFETFFNFKYLLSIDGTVAAYRLPFLLAGNSLVLKQDSNYFEHFYKDLEPWRHYVPVKRDLSDLITQIKWAQTHEAETLQIISNAQRYARDNLAPLNIFCAHVQTLVEYSKILSALPTKVPSVDEGFQLVEQPLSMGACDCVRDNVNDQVKDEL